MTLLFFNTSINTQNMKTTHNLIFHLADFYNGINPEFGTLKKERGEIFSEWLTESLKAKLLRCVNEILFEMVKTALKDTYLWGTTLTAHKNEVSTSRKIYYDKYNQFMLNQLVNGFYTRFLFKIYALPQELGFTLDIVAELFNNLSPDVREFLISEGI